MANTINQTDVFKFVALRPPVTIDKLNKTVNFIEDKREVVSTPVGILVSNFDRNDGSKIPAIIREFIKTKNFETDYPVEPIAVHLEKIFEYTRSIPETDIPDIRTKIESLTGSTVNSILDGDVLPEIWDRYYAFFILGKFELQSLETLTHNLRIFHLLKLIAEGFEIGTKETLNKILSATPLIEKIFIDLPLPKAAETAEPREDKPTEEQIKQYKKVWSELIDAQRAIAEVKNLDYEYKSVTEIKDVLIPNKETGIETKSKLNSTRSNLVVNKTSFNQLHNNTKALLKGLNISDTSIEIATAVTKLNNRFDTAYKQVIKISDPYFNSLMPEEAENIGGIKSRSIVHSAVKPQSSYLLEDLRAGGLIRPLGVGDLKVVKQKLKKYVAGEVAHIENVLLGESKERKHRVLDRTEDIFTLTNETDEETTKDTQTTERFELKKESEKTIQQQMSVQAGVTVTSSFGPVTTGAHGDFAYSTSSQESAKNSSNFAREVIDKSVSKIQKKTKEERTTKKLHEVEEINTHGFSNVGGNGNISGIYRWVDKVYEAQIYNYGKRLMFEFIVPEPSAFYEFAQTVPAPSTVSKPMLLELNSPNDIHLNDPESYLKYIKAYNVLGITPPPTPLQTISVTIAKDSMPIDGNSHVVTSKELIIPKGYFLIAPPTWDWSVFYKINPHFQISIGNRMFTLVNSNGSIGMNDNTAIDSSDRFAFFNSENIVQVSVNSYDVISYIVTVHGQVSPTPEALAQWQLQTFEKIVVAYNAAMTEYEQKLAAQKSMNDITIHGQNPRINRDIEQTELKKHCLKMLMHPRLYGGFDSMKAEPNTEPVFSNLDAYNEGKIIQFFEQAFEWHNLTYLFYPYFWSKKYSGAKNNNADRWVHKSKQYDTDPLFTKFLQSGAARVVIPVPLAYNTAILHYLETGEIWNGGDPPTLNDKLYISIADEFKNQTDDLANATPEGPSWEVTIPTTLVYLQQDMELPTF